MIENAFGKDECNILENSRSVSPAVPLISGTINRNLFEAVAEGNESSVVVSREEEREEEEAETAGIAIEEEDDDLETTTVSTVETCTTFEYADSEDEDE